MGKLKDSSSGVTEKRAGYQVGVFKDGRLKKIMKLKEGSAYIRQKSKKIKEDRPKRECSSKQLEALAKGRKIREKNRTSSSSSSSTTSKKIERVTSVKNQHRLKDSRVQGHRPRAEKARVAREKELDSGKHRSGGDSAYDSDRAYGGGGVSDSEDE